MSETNFTARELEYLNCETPMISTGSAVMRIVGGVFAAIGQSIIMPSSAYNKADKRIIRTVREIRYTRYKKVVLRKRDGVLTKKDMKTLEKLNKKDFVLEEDTYDPDKFKRELYEEYMRTHGEIRNNPYRREDDADETDE